MLKISKSKVLLEIYDRLLENYGPQYWWPGDTPFEIIIGAILTQSTAWTNVEKAITNLKSAGVLSSEAIRNLSLGKLAELIRPCGYYNAKAVKLKAFVVRLSQNYYDNLDNLFALDTQTLRDQLLSIHGIGNETADSIILYAANKPVFVIDAYTRRIIGRIGLLSEDVGYAAFQNFFMNNLPTDVRLFNEYHALLVRMGKEVCQKRPLCNNCYLTGVCRLKL